MAAQYKLPVNVPSLGDSEIGLNLPLMAVERKRILIEPSIDVNETAAPVYWAEQQHMDAVVLLFWGQLSQ
jgi:deoxyhypusine synthase